MKTANYLKLASLLFATAALLTGCGGADSDTGTGKLTLSITDAAVDNAEHVYVQFHGIELQGAGTRTVLYYCQDAADASKTVVRNAACTTAAAPKKIDLLALNSGLSDTLLNEYVLPAGAYNWIRLMVDTDAVLDSYIVVMGGASHELTIPSGSESGLKLNRGFVVPNNGSADFTIDFDLRKSIHLTGTGEYKLRPTLRLADNTLAGSIAGSVAASIIPSGCSPAVYVFAGSGTTPDDIDGIAPDPVTTASVKLNSISGEYRYTAAFLEAGNYTVAYTCQALDDDPTVDDALTFSGTSNATVTAKTTAILNF